MIHSVSQLHLPMLVFVSLFGYMSVPVVSEHLPDLVQFLSERADVNKVQPLCPHTNALIAQLIFCQTPLSSSMKASHINGSERK